MPAKRWRLRAREQPEASPARPEAARFDQKLHQTG
jgi:hypothetical protein